MQYIRQWMGTKEDASASDGSPIAGSPGRNVTSESTVSALLNTPCIDLLGEDSAPATYIFKAAGGVGAAGLAPFKKSASLSDAVCALSLRPDAAGTVTVSITPCGAPTEPSVATSVAGSNAAPVLSEDDDGSDTEPSNAAIIAASASGAAALRVLSTSGEQPAAAEAAPERAPPSTELRTMTSSPDIERPDPLLAKAFLTKVSGTKPPGAKDAPVAARDDDPYARFAKDLAPYYIAEHALQGLEVNVQVKGRERAGALAAGNPWGLGASPAQVAELKRSVLPLLQRQHHGLANIAQEEMELVLLPEAHALKLAWQARSRSAGDAVSLMDLLYDDAFVHGLLDWKLQPTGQAKKLLRFLVEAVAALHASNAAHGALSLQAVLYSDERGWHLSAPKAADTADDAAMQADREAVARIMCFVCLPPHKRKEFQPHRFADMPSPQLLEVVERVPSLKILAHALVHNRSAQLPLALDFYFWHELPVMAQVINDAKAVIRSMRIGSEEFDRRYNSTVLSGTNWRDALGSAIVPAIVTASREHVQRRDFSPYDFASAASLVRFVANTVAHFELLPLDIAVTRAAFLHVLLAAFPALVPACYHYLASCPDTHVHNRDSDLVFEAIIKSSDDAHKLIHHALAGCAQEPEARGAEDVGPAASAPALVWDMKCLESFHEQAPVRDDSVPADVVRAFAAWQCPRGASCPELAEGTCIKWHDERELRFAQEHLCLAFMEETCKRTACPNAHGFAEIRGAMNDTSPICWKWLECKCKVPHCRYAHTFRRHHDRQSRDYSRSSMEHTGPAHRTPRGSMDSERRSYARGSFDSKHAYGGAQNGSAASNMRRSVDNPRRSGDLGFRRTAPGGSVPRRSSQSNELHRPKADAGEGAARGGAAPIRRSFFTDGGANGKSAWGAARPPAPSPSAGPSEGAMATVDETKQQNPADGGWTKAPARKNGRNSHSSDRPPIGAPAAVQLQ